MSNSPEKGITRRAFLIGGLAAGAGVTGVLAPPLARRAGEVLASVGQQEIKPQSIVTYTSTNPATGEYYPHLKRFPRTAEAGHVAILTEAADPTATDSLNLPLVMRNGEPETVIPVVTATATSTPTTTVTTATATVTSEPTKTPEPSPVVEKRISGDTTLFDELHTYSEWDTAGRITGQEESVVSVLYRFGSGPDTAVVVELEERDGNRVRRIGKLQDLQLTMKELESVPEIESMLIEKSLIDSSYSIVLDYNVEYWDLFKLPHGSQDIDDQPITYEVDMTFDSYSTTQESGGGIFFSASRYNEPWGDTTHFSGARLRISNGKLFLDDHEFDGDRGQFTTIPYDLGEITSRVRTRVEFPDSQHVVVSTLEWNETERKYEYVPRGNPIPLSTAMKRYSPWRDVACTAIRGKLQVNSLKSTTPPNISPDRELVAEPTYGKERLTDYIDPSRLAFVDPQSIGNESPVNYPQAMKHPGILDLTQGGGFYTNRMQLGSLIDSNGKLRYLPYNQVVRTRLLGQTWYPTANLTLGNENSIRWLRENFPHWLTDDGLDEYLDTVLQFADEYQPRDDEGEFLPEALDEQGNPLPLITTNLIAFDESSRKMVIDSPWLSARPVPLTEQKALDFVQSIVVKANKKGRGIIIQLPEMKLSRTSTGELFIFLQRLRGRMKTYREHNPDVREPDIAGLNVQFQTSTASEGATFFEDAGRFLDEKGRPLTVNAYGARFIPGKVRPEEILEMIYTVPHGGYVSFETEKIEIPRTGKCIIEHDSPHFYQYPDPEFEQLLEWVREFEQLKKAA